MIDTNYEKLYIEGVKTGSKTVKLSSLNNINVTVIEQTPHLSNVVSYYVTNNNTTSPSISFTFSNLYLNGETYSAEIMAETYNETLVIPVVINNSDTLIYIDSESDDRYSDPITIKYTSTPVINNASLQKDNDIIDITDRLSNGSLYIYKNESAIFDYLIVNNGLSQISKKLEGYDPDPEIPTQNEVSYILHQGGYVYLLNADKNDIYNVTLDGAPVNLIQDGKSLKCYISDFGGGTGTTGNTYYETRILKFNRKENSHISFTDIHTLREVMYLDIKDVKDVNSFFNCQQLQRIFSLITSDEIEEIDSLFDHCWSLVAVPTFNTSKVTDIHGLFWGCEELVSAPYLDLANVRIAYYMYYGCKKLISVPELNMSKMVGISSFYQNFYGCENLTYLGGFNGIRASLDLSESSKLTPDSIVRVIEKLGEAGSYWGKLELRLGATNLSKISDDVIKIAIDKGWVVR